MRVDLPASQDVRVEFTEIWTEKAQKDLIAFANTLGGHLFFGVTDDGVLKGLSKKEVDKTVRSVLSYCRTGVEPVMVDLIIVDGRTETHRHRAFKKGFPLWEGLSYNGQQV